MWIRGVGIPVALCDGTTHREVDSARRSAHRFSSKNLRRRRGCVQSSSTIHVPIPGACAVVYFGAEGKSGTEIPVLKKIHQT